MTSCNDLGKEGKFNPTKKGLGLFSSHYFHESQESCHKSLKHQDLIIWVIRTHFILTVSPIFYRVIVIAGSPAAVAVARVFITNVLKDVGWLPNIGKVLFLCKVPKSYWFSIISQILPFLISIISKVKSKHSKTYQFFQWPFML